MVGAINRRDAATPPEGEGMAAEARLCRPQGAGRPARAYRYRLALGRAYRYRLALGRAYRYR